MKKDEIDYRRSITGTPLHNWGTCCSYRKGDKKKLGFFWLYLNNYCTDYYGVDGY